MTAAVEHPPERSVPLLRVRYRGRRSWVIAFRVPGFVSMSYLGPLRYAPVIIWHTLRVARKGRKR